MISVRVSGVGPGGRAGNCIELLKEATYDLIGICCRAQPIELRQHLGQRLLNFADGAVRIILTLRVEAALAFDELFPVKV